MPIQGIGCYVFLMLLELTEQFTDSTRANVTLQVTLSNKFKGKCDESAYVVTICAKEFTTECNPVQRFLQDTCAPSSSPESISFRVHNVESSIELSVMVHKMDGMDLKTLRPTEFLLMDTKEVSLASLDLLLIVRFRVGYVCLPNYFGKRCNKFCDVKAEEHICDESGNVRCKPGYFRDVNYGKCLKDQCFHMSTHCLNGGTCVSNQGPLSIIPKCICPANYTGERCESLVISATTTIKWTATTTSGIGSAGSADTSLTTAPRAVTIKLTDGHRKTLNNISTTKIKEDAAVTTQGNSTSTDGLHNRRGEIRERLAGMVLRNVKGSEITVEEAIDLNNAPEIGSVVKPSTISTGILGVLIIFSTLIFIAVCCLSIWFAYFRRRRRKPLSEIAWSESDHNKLPAWMMLCSQRLKCYNQSVKQYPTDYFPSVISPTYFANSDTDDLFREPVATPLANSVYPWRPNVANYTPGLQQPLYGGASSVATLPRHPSIRSVRMSTFYPIRVEGAPDTMDNVRQSPCYRTPSQYTGDVHLVTRPPVLSQSYLMSNNNADTLTCSQNNGSELLANGLYSSNQGIASDGSQSAMTVMPSELKISHLNSTYLPTNYPFSPYVCTDELEIGQQRVYGNPNCNIGDQVHYQHISNNVQLCQPTLGSASQQLYQSDLNEQYPFQSADGTFQNTDI